MFYNVELLHIRIKCINSYLLKHWINITFNVKALKY